MLEDKIQRHHKCIGNKFLYEAHYINANNRLLQLQLYINLITFYYIFEDVNE